MVSCSPPLKGRLQDPLVYGTHTHAHCKNVVHKATYWNYLELGKLMKAEDLLKPHIA